MLFVGDVKRDKGVGILLQAYAELQTSMPLVIIGHLCDDVNLPIPPNVHILSDWPHDAVMAAWRRCTFAIVPSIWHDPCPTVAMEAMTVGRPVIASRIGGLSDIIKHQETGILVPPGDVHELRNAMQMLLTHPEHRAYMGKRAQEHVVNFGAKTVVSRIERVYQDVIAQ